MQKLVIERVEDGQFLIPRQLLCRLNELVFRFSRDGRSVQYVNPFAIETLGWTAAEWSGFEPWTACVLDPVSQEVFEEFARSQLDIKCRGDMPNGDLPRFDSITSDANSLLLKFKTPAGSLIPIGIHTVYVARDELLALASCSDEHSSLQETLRQTQARFRSVVDGLSIRLVLKDRSGRRVYANQAYLEHRGISLSELVGKTDKDLFPADLAAKFTADDQKILRTGEILNKLEENVGRDGTRTWTQIIKGPIRDAENEIIGVQILLWDATARRRTELALEQERYLLHALLGNVPDSIYFKDTESRFVRISRGMAQKFSLPNPEIAVGRTDADIFTEEHARKAREDELQIMATGEPMISRVEKETWPDKPDTWCSTTKLPLYDSQGKIVGTFGISRDISNLKQAEQQLREARDIADRANAAKSQFLANMSHEIRTPMNGILGMTELLRHTHLDEDQSSFLEMIEQSAQSLLRIINDILDFSKVEAGKLELEPQPFDLRRCVAQAAKSLAARAAAKSLELVLEMDPSIPSRIIGDPDRLRQVLVNLVGNAIKFTQEGQIKIVVTILERPWHSNRFQFQFSVSDTGIGIEESKQESIFEAFAQADLSTTRQFGGTGLGLSISTQLVNLMGGKLWLESQAGVGSTFHFTALFEEFVQDEFPDEEEYDLTQFHDVPILLFDANESSRQTVAKSLELSGARVQATGDVQQAKQLYQNACQSAAARCAVILDESMVDAGFDLFHQAPSARLQSEPAVVIVTSMVHPQRFETTQQVYHSMIVQKPALSTEIISAVRRVLSRSKKGGPAQGAPAVVGSGTALRLLLAEDGAVNQAVFCGLLERQGHTITCVEDGQAAVECWRNNDFDAIFMDVQMPRLDGLGATRIIREEEQGTGRRIPIIALTAAAMESDRQRCREAGMDDYLSKPVNFDAFQKIIRSLESAKRNELHHTEPSSSPQDLQPPPTTLVDLRDSHTESAQAADTDTLNANRGGAPPSPTSASAATLDAPLSIDFDAPIRKLQYNHQQRLALIHAFRRETCERLDELRYAFANDDNRLLIRASHSLKSAAALFNATPVVGLSERVEEASRRNESELARNYRDQIVQATAAMLKATDDWLAEHS